MDLTNFLPTTLFHTRHCPRPHHFHPHPPRLHNHNSHYTHPLPHQKFSAICAAFMGSNSTGPEGKGTRLIFTYGTLKRGFYNYRLMESLISAGDASFVGEYTTSESFPLVLGPYGVPFLINLMGSGYKIPGEVYAVTDRGLARLDELEGIETGHYERLPVNVVSGDGKVVEVEAYFAHRKFAAELWRKHGEKGLRVFDTEIGQTYVSRANRPLGAIFIDDMWKFISQSGLKN